MCCRIEVTDFPSDPVLSQIMAIGGFVEMGSSPPEFRRWVRQFPPSADGRSRSVSAQMFDRADTHAIKFELAPTIGHHTYEDHVRNADMGAVVMKIAQTLAETANARIIQRALMGDCDTGHGELLLADYPEMPLRFEHMCFGFRTVLGEGVGQDRRVEVEA